MRTFLLCSPLHCAALCVIAYFMSKSSKRELDRQSSAANSCDKQWLTADSFTCSYLFSTWWMLDVCSVLQNNTSASGGILYCGIIVIISVTETLLKQVAAYLEESPDLSEEDTISSGRRTRHSQPQRSPQVRLFLSAPTSLPLFILFISSSAHVRRSHFSDLLLVLSFHVPDVSPLSCNYSSHYSA